jgi:L-amino acid N-acyltransferase
VQIEDAHERDLPQLVAILNDVIATSTAVFSEAPVALERQRDWLEERRARGFPVFVAREGQTVAAYASYGEFRAHSGYFTTVEHTVHVATEWRRRGIGRALLQTLIERARADGKHVMVGGVDAANAASVAMHEQLGFAEVGRMNEIAQKWGQWVDLVLLALWL